MALLNLIRWKNLLFITGAQYLIKYGLLISINAKTTLSNLEFIMLVLSTICLAAAGHIINAIYDTETDAINNPQRVIISKIIPEQTAYTYFIVFSVVGVGLGFLLSHKIDKSAFSGLFVMISISLYVYASYLKQTFLVGTILISILVCMSILIVGLFELLPAITLNNQQLQLERFKFVLHYTYFVFIINFLREVVKDIHNINGNYNLGMKTLPIVIGRNRTTKIVFVLSIVFLLILVYYSAVFTIKHPIALGYFVFLIIGPFLYFTIKILYAETKKEFQLLSKLLKAILLIGILSILLYPILD